MIHKIAVVLTDRICKYNVYTEEDTEKIHYALEVLMGESLKLIILCILFFTLKKFDYFTFSLLILITIRSFTGGFHFNSTLRCLVFTVLFFLSTSFFAVRFYTYSYNFYYALSFISFFIILLSSPRPSPQRPIVNKKRRWISKILSLVFSGLWLLILLFYIKDIRFLSCGVSTLLLQSIQLINLKECFKHE